MQKLVDCNGCTAEVEIAGEGPDVVFVGTAVPMPWTRGSAEALANMGYRVTNFDYGSGADDTVFRTALQQVDDVLSVMDAVGIDSAVLVGLSRGAMTAYGLAAEHGDRVDGVVLAFPVAGFEDTMLIVDPDPVPEDSESQEDFMRRALRTMFSDEFLAADFGRAVSLVTMPPGSAARVDRFDEDPFPDGLAISARTLIVEGGSDQIVKPEHPKRYLQAVDGAEYVKVENAEHGWLMEQPEEFARIVARFLS